MAILHGREPYQYPPLRQVALWDGTITYCCPVCGTHGDGTHKPGSEVCSLLVAERATKCRD